ncbi:MAG: DUF167 domain-containing protein [Candidatus Thorarchaeota archaeon]
MPENYIWGNEEGVFIRVLVKPKSRQRRITTEIDSGFLTVNLKAPAREGKANTELLKRLSKFLGVSTGHLRIVAGHKSREKTILVTDMTMDDVKKALLEALDSK